MIELWKVLKVGALFVALVSLLSIIMWLSGSVGILTPFAALLALVASPFFYWMGAIAKKRHEG